MGGLELRFRRLKPPERQSTISALQNTTFITLTALKESADAFPPLKSAVGGVLNIWELSRKVKSNQAACLELSDRVQSILDLIADKVPDATQLQPDLVERIMDFNRTLSDIQVFMEALRHRKVWTRLVRHKEDEGTLQDFDRRLNDTFNSFMLVSVINIQMTVSRSEKHNRDEFTRLDNDIKSGNNDIMSLIRQNDDRTQMQLKLIVLFN